MSGNYTWILAKKSSLFSLRNRHQSPCRCQKYAIFNFSEEILQSFCSDICAGHLKIGRKLEHWRVFRLKIKFDPKTVKFRCDVKRQSTYRYGNYKITTLTSLRFIEAIQLVSFYFRSIRYYWLTPFFWFSVSQCSSMLM